MKVKKAPSEWRGSSWVSPHEDDEALIKTCFIAQPRLRCNASWTWMMSVEVSTRPAGLVIQV